MKGDSFVDLCIAGLPISVESADDEYFARRFAEYIRMDERVPMMRMRTRRCDYIEPVDGETVMQIERVRVVRLADGRFCRYARAPGQTEAQDGPVLFSITYTPDYASVDICLLNTRCHPVFSLTDFEYIYTGGAFQNRLAFLGGGVLHSSSIAYNGKGIAFSAPSGTGKSTHVGLWKERFGEAVEIINDDKPAVYFDNGQAMLCGTPWSGKTALNVNRTVPLYAIVFIERGTDNHIEKLDTVDSMFYLTSQVFRPYYDEALGVQLLDFTERLQASVPIYRLTCDISQQAVETVFRAIFPAEESI